MYRLLFSLIIFIVSVISLSAQNKNQEQLNITKDPILFKDSYDYFLGDGNSDSLYFYTLKPQSKAIGMIVLLPGMLQEPTSVFLESQLPREAMKQGYLVIVPTINNVLIADVNIAAILSSLCTELERIYEIPKGNVFLGGINSGAGIVFSYAESANMQGSSNYKPKAIFAVNPYLDLSFLWNASKKQIARKCKGQTPAMAKHINYNLFMMTGGTPETEGKNYALVSPFSSDSLNGGNAQLLSNTPIKIYYEPEFAWRSENQCSDLYDMNLTPITAFVNTLKQLGNKNVELHITELKGFNLDGSRNPDSWSICEPKEILTWFKTFMK